MAPGPGVGSGLGAGPGVRPGSGVGPGSRGGPEAGSAPGVGPAAGPGSAIGPGSGVGVGVGSGSGLGSGARPIAGGGPGVGGRADPGDLGIGLGRENGRGAGVGAGVGLGPDRSRDADTLRRVRTYVAPAGGEPDRKPPHVLYLTTGDELGSGRVYQVNFHGLVLGRVDLPLAGTGITLQHDKSLLLAVPRDGGHILQIDEVARVSTLVEHNKLLLHPIDVAVGAGTDTIVVSDNISNVLATMTTDGADPAVSWQFDNVTVRRRICRSR